MIIRFLHSWLFHIKFMKLAESLLHKFHVMSTRVRSSIYAYNCIFSTYLFFLKDTIFHDFHSIKGDTSNTQNGKTRNEILSD